MGRKRQRLIVQADLTSEEDQAFLAWVKQKLRRRKLAEEIREGLRLRYERVSGQAVAAYKYPNESERSEGVPASQHEALREREGPRVADKLQRLVQSL